MPASPPPLHLVFLSLAALFIGFAIWQISVSFKTLSTHQPYPATVIRCHSTSSSNARHTLYACDVKYQTPAGRRSATVDKLLFSFKPGDTIEILVGTGEQYSVKAGGFIGLWAIPTLLASFAIMILTITLWPHKKK